MIGVQLQMDMSLIMGGGAGGDGVRGSRGHPSQLDSVGSGVVSVTDCSLYRVVENTPLVTEIGHIKNKQVILVALTEYCNTEYSYYLFQQPAHQTVLFLNISQSRQYNCCNRFPSRPFKLIISFKDFQPIVLSISFFCEICLS